MEFHTSPYSKKIDNRYVRQNAMSFKMSCETFLQFNGTHNNTVAHLFFKTSKNEYGYEASSFDDKYANTNVTINRTDSNTQVFNLTMRESINFL